MAPDDEDDKTTVVLDLNALKKEKLKQEEDLANIGQSLEFAVNENSNPAVVKTTNNPFKEKTISQVQDSVQKIVKFKIILFDFQSNFFQKSLSLLPEGYDYQITTNLNELNQHLKSKDFQIVVFNYDANPKAVNQLCAQIKQKIPSTKTMIIAKAISPDKAILHAKTPSGANGYYQLPIEGPKLEKEFRHIYLKDKKISSN